MLESKSMCLCCKTDIKHSAGGNVKRFVMERQRIFCVGVENSLETFAAYVEAGCRDKIGLGLHHRRHVVVLSLWGGPLRN